VKGIFNSRNFLIQIPARVDSEEFNLALDVGTPVSFISGDLISKWSKVHSSWPSMHGAIGVANLWGTEDEPTWQLLRINYILYGGIAFSNLVAVSCPQNWLDYFTRRVGMPTAGLIGAEALLDYQIGIDYTHGIVYFHRIGNSLETDMDLVGLTLRPEPDGDYEEKPSVKGILKGDILLTVNKTNVSGLTMGGVWAGAPDNQLYFKDEELMRQIFLESRISRLTGQSSNYLLKDLEQMVDSKAVPIYAAGFITRPDL
jgi:hypothetical protein